MITKEDIEQDYKIMIMHLTDTYRRHMQDAAYDYERAMLQIYEDWVAPDMREFIFDYVSIIKTSQFYIPLENNIVQQVQNG